MIKIGNYKNGDRGFFVGRPTPLGNPYHIGQDGTREEVINKYRTWFLAEVHKTSSPVYRSVHKLLRIYRAVGKVTLLCYCAPEPCHAEVIRDHLLMELANDA